MSLDIRRKEVLCLIEELKKVTMSGKLYSPQCNLGLREKKVTEPPFSGQYCQTHKAGAYECICCNSPLFSSSLKFNSNSGWPSFTEPISNKAIKYVKDKAPGMIRVEVMCNVCDAHLGHVFPDGPEGESLRFCINSESIKLQQN